MKKLMFAMVSLLTLTLVACSTDSGNSPASTSLEEKELNTVVVGFSVSTLNNPFFVSLRDGIVTNANEFDITVEVADAQDDVAKQLNDIEDLIQKGIDILAVNPTDSAGIVTAIELANERNIPVITIDRSANSGEIATFISSDNISGGEMAAQFILDSLGENINVVELEGVPGASATRERGTGFHNIATGSLNVVTSQSANFNRAEGLNVMENILQGNSDIQAVFAHNDEMAIGAAEAISNSGRDIIVVGFDGSDDGVDAVKSGRLDATIAQQPELMGELAIDSVIRLVHGENVESYIGVPLKLIVQ